MSKNLRKQEIEYLAVLFTLEEKSQIFWMGAFATQQSARQEEGRAQHRRTSEQSEKPSKKSVSSTHVSKK